MVNKHEQSIFSYPTPFGRFQRSIVYWIVGIAYFFALFLVQHTLLSVTLLTATYGAWMLAYYAYKRCSHPLWSLALFALGCASLFTPEPASNAYWIPILPTATACVLTTAKPRALGLGLACALWLSTSVALFLLTGKWDIGAQVVLLISFGSSCGCTIMISELAIAHRHLQEYSAQIEQLSVIQERNRIAREIHDTLGHALTLLSVQLETATQLETRGDPRLREELQEARRVVKTCLADVRHSVEALRPEEASGGSLLEQLHQLVATFEMTCHQTAITLDLEEATHQLPSELDLTLYRCTQEALTNIRKHAHATKVLLRLSTSDEMVELTVLDNGQGPPSSDEQHIPGFGLLGMRERVTLQGGTLRAGPQPQQGWRVEIMLPLKKQKSAKLDIMNTNAIKGKISL